MTTVSGRSFTSFAATLLLPQMDAGVGNNGTTSFYATVEPEVAVNLSGAFRLLGHFVFKPVFYPIEGHTNVFRAQPANSTGRMPVSATAVGRNRSRSPMSTAH